MAICRKYIAVCVWAFASVLALVHTAPGQDAGFPSTRLFDTASPAASPLASATVAARTGWAQLAEDDTTHEFKGDIALVNNRLTVVLRKLGTGAEVYVRHASTWRRRASVLPVPVGGGSVTALSSVRIVENTPSGVRLDCQYRTVLEKTEPVLITTIGYRLIPGDPGIEVYRGPGLFRVRVDADIRYAVVPNYFGDDMVFTKDSAGATDAAQLTLPTEQLLLAMLSDGGGIVICVCQSDQQEFRIVLRGTGQKRRIAAAAMRAMEGKRIWVAFMEDRGIWTALSAKSGGPASTSGVASRWTPPFAAKWRFDKLEGDILGHAACNPRAVSSPYSKDILDKHGTSPFLIYPLERDRDTPLTKLCMTDIMRNTLGVGPCQYIIAAEGLNSDTPHEVTDWVVKQFARKRETRAAEIIRNRFDQMVEHVEAAQQRIERYRQIASQVVAACDAEIGKAPFQPSGPASDVATRIRRLAQMLQHSIVIDEPDLRKCGYGRRPAAAIVGLIGKSAPAAALDAPVRELNRIGNAQDKTLANCRMAVKWLKLQSAELRKRSPRAAEFLSRVQMVLTPKVKE